MCAAWRAVSVGLGVLIGSLALGCSGDEPKEAAGGAPSGGDASSTSGASGGPSLGGIGGSGVSGSAGSAGSAMPSGGSGSEPVEPEGCVADPVELSEAPGITVLAGEGTMQRFSVVQLGADQVFVTTELGIERVSKQGGTTELIVAGTDKPRFRVGGENLYFIKAGALYSVPTTATAAAATLVAADIGVDEPNDDLLVVDAGYAYLWQRGSGAITRLELSSGQITPVVETPGRVWHIYDGFMYYGDDFDRVLRAPLAGGEPEIVYGPQAVVWSMAVGAQGLFIGSYGAIYAQADPLRVTVFEDPFKLGASQMYIERVAIHGDQLLFSGSAIGDDRIGWVKIDGSACATFKRYAFWDEWALDDTHLYVAGGTLLYKIPL
ncbi:MAG TPA: hypothetical protein VJN18_15390 [Polyangiaceae bacterium]|nr:hypothetical protein [Polyangiaceae bacterium]